MIEVRMVVDSIGTRSPRLSTMFWRYPKFVHQESLRHRKVYFEDHTSARWYHARLVELVLGVLVPHNFSPEKRFELAQRAFNVFHELDKILTSDEQNL